jgi:NADPH2 dehydrogenase
MTEAFKATKISSLKTVAEFRAHLARLGLPLPCDDIILKGNLSPLTRQVTEVVINGKTIGNRVCVHPMEGWDGDAQGLPTGNTLRRWQRFGESGAKLIFGGEAMAVCPEGRSNPRQIMIQPRTLPGLVLMREGLVKAHKGLFGRTDDLVIGFQLTHSGRFCRPNDNARWEPRVAFRHPLLDRRFGVVSDAQVFTDDEIERLVDQYVVAARVARDAGADFVDIKHCHGYLLHEFLGAFTRPGRFGGSFENRTRILRDIVAAIRADGNSIDLGLRLSAFDFVPFRPDPVLSQPGRLGPGIPEDYSHCLPYRYAFGCNQVNPVEYDLSETCQFMQLCGQLGIKIVNLSAGSPYYNPHIQRPALYPPSDGYQPAYDPLVDVFRQIEVVRQLKASAPSSLVVVGTGYTYLQEYLPHVAQAVIREGWTALVGLGRAVLSYPAMLADAIDAGAMNHRAICRTFSDCTSAPRNSLVSGCYPLDKYYSTSIDFQRLKEVKRAKGV